jgi:hypothetical protein
MPPDLARRDPDWRPVRERAEKKKLLGEWSYGSAKRAYERTRCNEARAAAVVNRAADTAAHSSASFRGRVARKSQTLPKSIQNGRQRLPKYLATETLR